MTRHFPISPNEKDSRQPRSFQVVVWATLLLLVLATTVLAEKPPIEIDNQTPRESCNLATVAWEWDLRTSDAGFSTTMCDAQGVPCWAYAPGTGWYTGSIDLPYPNDAGQALISPTWTVGPDNYLMEIEHWFDMESGYDGGNIKINGQLVEPVGGYPGIISVVTSYYAWCVDDEPGFTGNSAAWVTDCFDLSPWMGEEISVALEFGSDNGYSGLGWVLAGITVGTAGPQTYVVQPDGSGDFATIQSAIDAAIPGDTIELADGMFAGDGNRDLDFKGKAITIRSQSGDPELCYINCEGYVDDPHYGFVFYSNEGPDSILEGVSIIQGFYTSLDTDIFTPGCRRHHLSQGEPDHSQLYNILWVSVLLATEGADARTGPVAAGIAINFASPVLQDCRITSNTLTVEGVPSDGHTRLVQSFSCGSRLPRIETDYRELHSSPTI